ncbi:hypothetical protein [Okeania sp. KiyG1]|uniref:hypothetical protein n=1 Tax=Okeania sp. KiyG1 TaxID=2720165 RepID=UPI0019219FB9|nr:hypothetical protein [Okeania sp. KiyG1]GGA09552.1 hypothetical protein CYANOKiyG1_22410 [Okeania sp. KiyG1]
MVKHHALDKIIRKVEKAEASAKSKTKSSTEKIIVINKQKKDYLDKIPFIDRKNIVYYLISNNNDASNIAERTDLPVEVTDFGNNRKLRISVAYRASCPPGKEQQVALALCSDDSPGDELDKRVERWIAELTYEKEAIYIDDFFGQVEGLQTSLKKKTQDEIGLNIHFRLSLGDEKQLEAVKIGPTEITVYVSDSDDKLDLELETELIIEDPVKAVSNQESGWLISLVKVTKKEIKSYLLEKVSITQFYYELKDTVRNGLVEHLDRILRDQGRRVGHLYLNSKKISSSPVPKELVEISCTVDCKVQKYTGLVYVENTLQMLPQDVRRYISAQSPNLEAWVQSKLEKIVKPLLLDKNYAGILCDFSKESDEIRRAMQTEAESIGYLVKHIVSLPKQKHSELLENLEINNDDKPEEFSTSATGVKVKLSTAVNLKFKSLEKIEDYLNQTVDEIKDLIKDTVKSTTRENIRTIDPERFYMRFYEPIAGEKSVEQELKDAITTTLEERFGVIVIRVVPIPEQTDIIDYLQRLMGMVGSFNCEVLSLTGGQAVKFQGEFKILGIEQGSWYVFQSAFQSMRELQQESLKERKALKKQYAKVVNLGDVEENREELGEISQRIRDIEKEIFGMDNIKNSIEKSVNAKLTTIDSELLRYTDNKHLSTMERYVNQWARESVVKQYGLEIEIINLYRIRTEGEEYLSAARTKLERSKVDEALAQVEARTQQRQNQLEMSSRKNKAQSNELDKLYEQRAKLVADPDADPDEREYLDEQIDRLEKEILTPSLEDAGSALDILEPKRDGSKNTLAFEEQMGLLPGKNNLDSDPSSDTSVPNQKDLT